MTTRDATRERAALADEVRLADELVQRSGSHSCGQRLPLGRRLKEGLRSSA
jgi:hypothetical protein